MHDRAEKKENTILPVYTAEERAYIWLDSFPLDDGEKRSMVKEAGGAAAIVRDFSRFRENAVKTGKEGVYNNMSETLSDGGVYYRAVSAALVDSGTMAVTAASALYPRELRVLSAPPLVLYARGDVSLLRERKFTVVGSRRTPAAARKTGKEICHELSEAFVLVTGTADGGDSAVIEGALEGGGRIICVAAGGFSSLPQGNLSLLQEVRKRGLLLAAHPASAPVRQFSYESRNSILAALGEGVLVLGAGEKSGALITARYAAETGKPVFALPYPPGTDVGVGCNALIKKGAFLTENSFDISERFGINLKKEKTPSVLSEEEGRVLSALRSLGEAHIGELSAACGLPAFRLYAILSALEVKGATVRLGGNRFAPV